MINGIEYRRLVSAIYDRNDRNDRPVTVADLVTP